MLIHSKHDGSNKNLIIMLHGTGGNENDLVSIARFVDSQATLIGIRGNVEEQGMLRYFKRYPDGSFDLKDLAKNTSLLFNGIKELIQYYKLDDYEVTLLGYSNGANIAINILKEFETDYSNAILFHPSPVRVGVPIKKQKNLRVFATTGTQDPFITQDQFATLINEIKDAGIETEAFSHDFGHQLIQEELIAAKAFFK